MVCLLLEHRLGSLLDFVLELCLENLKVPGLVSLILDFCLVRLLLERRLGRLLDFVMELCLEILKVPGLVSLILDLWLVSL